MAVTLTGSGGLFTILGKIFHAQATLNTARGTTVPDEVIDAIDAFEPLTNTFNTQAVIANLETTAKSWQDNSTLATGLQTFAKNTLIRMVGDDADLPSETFANALAELVSQMEGSGGETDPDDDVDASTAAVSVSAGGSNAGDGVLTASIVRGDGRNAETALAEAIAGTMSGTSITLKGELAESNRLSYNWPQGSGASTSLTPVTSGTSLLNNGGFDTETKRTDAPDDWIVQVGTIGTTVKMTGNEVQTVIVSGSPGSGAYTLTYTNPSSDVQTTAPLAYNATGPTVQAALRTLDGLGSVTVSTTGTSPNYTHTITFTGEAGNLTTLSSANTFDQGSIAHAQVTAGSANAFIGKAVEFDANGSEVTELRQRVTLSAETPYAFNCYMKVDTYPAAGALKVELVDGGGTVIADSQGTDNAITINPQSGGDLSTSGFTAINGFFRLPAVVPNVVYLRIRMSTAVSSGSSIFIDEAALVAATSLYTGGPVAAAFAGATSFAATDTWTVTVTNDRAGGFQEWFHRNFEMGGVLLPSDAAAGETVADSLIG